MAGKKVKRRATGALSLGADSEDVIAEVVRMHYMDGLTQRQVAERTGFSVATVSRMVARARSTGMVSIRINRTSSHDNRLAGRLCTRYGLEQAVVVTGRDDPELDREGVHEAGANLFGSLLREGMTVGVTWGETLDGVIGRLEPQALPGCEVVQVTGALGHGATAIDGPGLAFRLADKLGAPCHLVNAPARAHSRQARRQLLNQPQVAKAVARAAQADILLHGVGALDGDSSLVRAGYLTSFQRKRALERGAVGQVLARIVDKNCVELPDYAGRAVGISLADAKRIRLSVGIVSAKSRSDALAACLRGGMFTHLVTGEAVAARLVSQPEAKAA